jgi:hypothetical protein
VAAQDPCVSAASALFFLSVLLSPLISLGRGFELNNVHIILIAYIG